METEHVEVPSLLHQAEEHLQSGQVHRALVLLQEADPNAKGVREALAVAEVITAVEAGAKRGCGCSKEGYDWYSILGVDPASDEAAIKRKFKQYALYCHPDKNSSSRASEAFKWVSEAHAVLSDSVQRAMFGKQRVLMEAPCVSCLLKRTTLDERLRSVSIFQTEEPTTSGSFHSSKASQGSFHSAEAFSFRDLTGTAGLFNGSSRSSMPDPVFAKARDADWSAEGSNDSWRERRERWLNQLDKSKAKAQVRKQAWDDGLRNFDAPVSHKKPPLVKQPYLFTPTAGQTPAASQDSTHSSEFRRKPSTFETLRAFAGTTRVESQNAKSTQDFKQGGRFAVDETKAGLGVKDNPRRQVPLTIPTAVNEKEHMSRNRLEESFEREVLLKGRQHTFEDSEDILNGNCCLGGVLRQRRDTNRSEWRSSAVERDGLGQGFEKVPFGREHTRSLEKENVEAFGGRTYGLFQQHGSGGPTIERDPARKVVTAHEQLLSTLRRLKEDGLGTVKSKKVGLSFGPANATTLKNHGYRAVYNNPQTEVYNSTMDRNSTEGLLQRLRELRMDDGRFVT